MRFISKSKISLLIYGSARRLTIDIGNFLPISGQLMAAELFALFSIPFFNIRKLLKKHEGLRVILTCLLVLLVCQIFSDVVNQSTPTDFMRGWSLIVFSMISITFFVGHLSKKTESIVYYLFGLIIVNSLFGQGELDLSILEQDTNYFKVRFIGFVSPLVILCSYYLFKKGKRETSLLFIIVYGIIAVTLDARSTGVIFTLSGFLIAVKVYGVRLNQFKLGVSAILIAVILYMGYVIYVNQVINHGFGGDNAQSQLARAENPYNPFDLLMEGRGDVAVALYAISEKPFIGHGSWAKDRTGRYHVYSENVLDNPNLIQSDFIRSHSILFTAWLWSGLVGFLAMLYIFIYMIKTFYKVYLNSSSNSLLLIVIILFNGIVWHFLFSPYGHLRTDFPVIAALLIVLGSSNYIKTK